MLARWIWIFRCESSPLDVKVAPSDGTLAVCRHWLIRSYNLKQQIVYALVFNKALQQGNDKFYKQITSVIMVINTWQWFGKNTTWFQEGFQDLPES